MNLEDIKRRVSEKRGHLQAAEAELTAAKRLMLVSINNQDETELAHRLIQTVARVTQELAHARIASVVSRCLTTVFDEPYDFKVVFEQKRGRTEARLVFVRDGHEIDPLTASGGGVIDVAAFALRLSSLMLSRPMVRPVLIMDEPFRFLSAGYRGRVRHLLDALATELGVQFILVTHHEEFRGDVCIAL